MGLPEFDRLATQFSKLHFTGEKAEIAEIQAVMRAAGRALYAAISSKKIYLGETPSWLKRKPKKSRRKSNGVSRTVFSWDLYWWCAVAWLIRQKLDSGIIYSPRIKRIRFRKDLLGCSLRRYLVDKKGLPTKKWRQICYSLAKASETACLYLAGLTAAEGMQTPKPVSQRRTAESQPIKKRFAIRHGQILFDGKDLNIRVGTTLEIMKMLVNQFDNVVPFRTLDEYSKECEASDKIRTAISRIRKKLKSVKIQAVIENRYGEGYIMHSSTR
jgi:hypothetical protein